MRSSDSDSDSDWNREMFIAVSKKQGKGRNISEQERCRQIQDCLDQGADIDTLDNNGDTVLHVAVKKGYQEVVRFLQESGANIVICNQLDCTPETLADNLGKLEIASILRNPDKKQTEKAGSKFTSLDNERPSTSRESYLLDEQPSYSKWPFQTEKFESLKRKATYDTGIEKNARKRRSVLNNASQRDSHRGGELDISPRLDTFEVELPLRGNTTEIIPTSCLDQESTYVASGLKRSSHGIIYQLKHLMLILNRTRKMGYPFRLSTEMDAAEKFDDLVLHYRNHSGNEVHRFVQMKHKQDESKRITAHQLLDVKDGEFSVLKYLISWRKIKRHPDFGGSTSKIFILCTNIGLDVEGLKVADIDVSRVGEPDQFLKVIDRTEQPPRYKLLVKEESELYDTLKTASDVHQLARVLAQRVHDCKEIDLKTHLFKRYHIALAEEVVDTGRKRFFVNFIKNRNLSASGEKFRQIFFLNIRQLPAEIHASAEDTWKRLEQRPLKLSSAFGRKLKITTTSMPTKLPDDHISGEEISEFLNEFILAVDQPNEVELGEMIKQELGADSQFNLLDADFIGDSFQNVMLDWFKEGGRFGKFLKNEDADKFFNETEIKLSSLITMGLSLEYPEKLKKCEIEFNCVNIELQNFLDSSYRAENQILQFTSSSETLLAALRVHQTLMQIPKFKKNDSFIFINLKTLLLPKILERVLRAFEWPRHHDLLVIDCESISLKEYKQKLWNPLCNILKENSNKRAIIIIQGNRDSGIRLQISYKSLYEKDDDISIDNLTEYSRQKLLEKKVIKFQGHEERTSFRRLLGNDDFDDTRSKELGDLRRIIDPNTLVQLITGEEIRIGSEVMRLGEIQDYYIPRTIVQRVIIPGDAIEDLVFPDVFAFCGISKESLKKLLPNKQIIRSFDDTNQAELRRQEFVILDNGLESYQFKILCALNTDRNIHWLQAGAGEWIWKYTFGKITTFSKYKNINQGEDDYLGPGATYLKEDQLVEQDDHRRIVIISDVAGMGKSTVLTSLSGKLKDNDPSLLVIKINLTQYTTVLAEQMANPTFDFQHTNEAVDFLVDKLSGRKTDLESQFYKTILKNNGEAALLFDGFDEISPTYGNIVIELLQALVELPIKKIFITTRPYTRDILERSLNTFSHRLQPFSQDDQIEFLKKIWKQGLIDNHCDRSLEKRLESHADRVMNLLAGSIDHRMTEFTGVPLQTRMVAEVFEYGKEETPKHFDALIGVPGSADDLAKLPTRLDMIDLYSRFVDKKYNVFFTEKQSGDDTNLAAIQSRDIGRRIFLKTHQKFSLDALFDGKTVKSLLRSQPDVESCVELCREIDEGAERTGIITQVIDGVPHFIHRTFAEYFAAVFIAKTLTEDSRNKKLRKFFVMELFVKPQHKTIRAFLNGLLSGTTSALEWELDLREDLLMFRETLYHVAAKERNDKIVTFFLKRLGPQRLYQPRFDKFTFPGCRFYKPQHRWGIGRFNKLQWLVKYGRKFVGSSSSNSKGGIRLVDYLDPEEKTVLSIAVNIPGNFCLVKCLVDGGASLNPEDGSHLPPLHDAAGNFGDLPTVKYLIEKGANVHSQYEIGWTPLHYAAANKFGNLDVVEHLIENGVDIQARDCFDSTPLHLAVDIRDNSVIAKYLIDKGADIHTRDKDGRTPLHIAVKVDGNDDVVKYLLEKGADVNAEDRHHQTPLHLGVGNALNLETVKYLIEKGASIEAFDHAWKTPLHHGADVSGALDIVNYLVEKGANIHVRDEDRRTPLHYAADVPDNLEMVKHLVEKGADIKAEDKLGSTPLHYAVSSTNNMYIVHFLVYKGADIHAEDKEGLTPLHYLAANRPLNPIAIKYLIDKGGNIHAKDKRGWTPLDYVEEVYDLGDFKRLVELTEKFLDIDFHDEFPRVFKVVNYLLDEGADIESRNNYGWTPLHVAAKARKFVEEYHHIRF